MPSILDYDFMIRALIGGIFVGTLAPALGTFLVLRRLSLFADSLAHVALAGVAIGLFTNTFPVLAALAATSIAALTIEFVRSRRIISGDAALAVVLYCALAIAIVIISLADGFTVDLFTYLFGSILTVNSTDLWLLAILTLVTIGFIVIFYSELTQSAFDSDLARINGIRVFSINLVLAVLTGATITLSMRVVGVLLVGALIVIPVLISLKIASGMRAAISLSVMVGIACSLIGLTVAFYADVAAGGSVVLVAAMMLIITLVGSFFFSWINRSRIYVKAKSHHTSDSSPK